MAIWILSGDCGDGIERAALVDSVTMHAFGPLFDSDEEAESFLAYLEKETGDDARSLDDGELDDLVAKWRATAANTEPADAHA